MNNDTFITQKPKSRFVQKYIKYYYFHLSKDISYRKKFMYYPNHQNALTIYKNANVKYYKNHSVSFPDSKLNYYMAYSGIQPKPRIAEILGPFTKVGVIFKPIGINYYLKNSLDKVISNIEDKGFTALNDKLIPFCDTIFEEEPIDKRVELLDSFFEKNFIGFKEERLVNAIEYISSSGNELSVQDVADYISVNRKTLLRLFNKHLNCSVKDYLSIVQFRKALDIYQLAANKPAFVELAYESDYYDQSEFINHFKKITGFNPKKLFKDLEHLGTEDTFFTFLDD